MISIRETQAQDTAHIAACLGGKPEEFARQCGYGKRFFTFPITEKQVAAFQKTRRKGSLFFTILSDEVIVGSLELILHEGCGTIARFLIYDDYRLKGHGTAALRLLVMHAFGELGLRKLGLGVFAFNESALRCYEKAGFAETGRVTIDGWPRIDMEIHA